MPDFTKIKTIERILTKNLINQLKFKEIQKAVK